MSIDINNVGLKILSVRHTFCVGNHRIKLPRTQRDLRCGDSGSTFQNFDLVTS